jgi:vancomycin resistance protein YoaR
MTISYRFYIFLKWLLFLVAVFVIAGSMGFGFYVAYERKYEGKFFPGTEISGIAVGGMTLMEAEGLINKKIDELKNNGIAFVYHNERAVLALLPSATEADIVWPVAMYDIEKAVKTAFEKPRSDSWLFNLTERISLWNNGHNFFPEVSLREDEVSSFLNEKFSHFSTPARNAALAVNFDNKDMPEFSVTEESYGQALDLKRALSDLKGRLSRLDNGDIIIEAAIEFPTIFKKDTQDIPRQAADIAAMAPIDMIYEDKKWTIEKNKLIELLALKADSDQVFIGLDAELSQKYFEEEIAIEINQPAIDAKFEVVDGRVEVFQINQDGLVLNISKAREALEEAFALYEKKEIVLTTEVLASRGESQEMEDLGIREIIGSGHSSFKGSPSNRRHNIKIGADSVNGTLIAPGEEFSLLGALGKIDGSTGYLQELVIKDGKTIPEYGGGLCQIGTTVFRGTVNAGLPVTMRRNHSYRVSYYEPAGTDATIYDPWPDYKFKNDTSHHVLIQSRIDKDDLYFDFWGTSDGRVATNTYPVIYNIVRPGPTKIIETLDLAPGVRKCTEKAHNGADAYFDYTVIYPDGREEETRFKSHYVPWREVCLLGVEELTIDKEKKAEASSASSTPEL